MEDILHHSNQVKKLHRYSRIMNFFSVKLIVLGCLAVEPFAFVAPVALCLPLDRATLPPTPPNCEILCEHLDERILKQQL